MDTQLNKQHIYGKKHAENVHQKLDQTPKVKGLKQRTYTGNVLQNKLL